MRVVFHSSSRSFFLFGSRRGLREPWLGAGVPPGHLRRPEDRGDEETTQLLVLRAPDVAVSPKSPALSAHRPATGARSPLMGSRRANDRGGGGLSVHTRADCP